MQNDPQEIQIVLQMHLKSSVSLDDTLDAHFAAIQHTSSYVKYQLMQKLWKQVIYKAVQQKRKMVKDNKLQVHMFTNFINYIVGWFSLVLTRLPMNEITFPVIFHCYVYMGDLARYRDQCISENMTMARESYQQAEELWPQNGLVHHQIAVIATLQDQDLEALYRYIRSLYGIRAPDMAGNNLKKFLEKRIGANVQDTPPEQSTIEKSLLYLIKVNMNQTNLKSVYTEFFLNIFKSNFKQLAPEESTWIVLICSVLPDNHTLLIQLLNLTSQIDHLVATRLILMLLHNKHLEAVPPGLCKYVSNSSTNTPTTFLKSDYYLLGFTPLFPAFRLLNLPINYTDHQQAIMAKHHFDNQLLSSDSSMVQLSIREWTNHLLIDNSSDEDEFVLHRDPESQLKLLAEQSVVGFLDCE
eukprot:NODE_64_length_24072_cov_0.332541.p6 type:complete len:411 gc:universal NODE_64_length_24072_cov_0.332541:9464-8232(-)